MDIDSRKIDDQPDHVQNLVEQMRLISDEGGIEKEDEEDINQEEMQILPNQGTNFELQPYIRDFKASFPIRTTIDVRKHCNITRSGRVFSFSAFVMIGNGNGAAGLGYGRGIMGEDATKKALLDAQKNIVTIVRDGKKINTPRITRYKSCKIMIFPRRKGDHFNQGSQIIFNVCAAFGIQGVHIRFLERPRSKRKQVMYKALFQALKDLPNSQEIAAQTGRLSYDYDSIFRRKYYKYIY